MAYGPNRLPAYYSSYGKINTQPLTFYGKVTFNLPTAELVDVQEENEDMDKKKAVVFRAMVLSKIHR